MPNTVEPVITEMNRGMFHELVDPHERGRRPRRQCEAGKQDTIGTAKRAVPRMPQLQHPNVRPRDTSINSRAPPSGATFVGSRESL